MVQIAQPATPSKQLQQRLPVAKAVMMFQQMEQPQAQQRFHSIQILPV